MSGNPKAARFYGDDPPKQLKMVNRSEGSYETDEARSRLHFPAWFSVH
jgi:hypothetical protein